MFLGAGDGDDGQRREEQRQWRDVPQLAIHWSTIPAAPAGVRVRRVSAGTIVSLVVGTWGAVVATILGVREIRRDKRQVRIECETRWGKMPVDTTGMGEITGSPPAMADELFVRIRVQNVGHRPVEARHVRFLNRGGRALPVAMDRGMPLRSGGRQLPKRIGDGEALVVDVPTRTLEDAMRQVQAPIETVEVQVSGEWLPAPFPRY